MARVAATAMMAPQAGTAVMGPQGQTAEPALGSPAAAVAAPEAVAVVAQKPAAAVAVAVVEEVAAQAVGEVEIAALNANGRSGSSGGAGERGGAGGFGGGGGGAFQITALGRVSIGVSGSTTQGLFARGGAGGTGVVGGEGGDSDDGTPSSGAEAGAPTAGQAGTSGSGGAVSGNNGGDGGEEGSGGAGGGGGGGGGNGGTGGEGGDGGDGAGGAGGTVKIVGTVIEAGGVRVDTKGGSGSEAGANGRFIIAGNTNLGAAVIGSPGQVASVGGAPGNLVANTTTTFFAGPRATNPFLDNALPTTTPYIAGVAGGAELFGLLGVDADEIDFDPTQPGRQDIGDLSGVDVPGNALAAVVRLPVGPETIIPGIDFSDDYTGYDFVLFVNLTDIALSNPRFGLTATDNNSFDNALMISAYSSTIPLTGLGANQVWATLVPETSVFVNASVDGSASEIDGQSLTASGANAARFITAQKASLNVAADIGALHAIAVGTDGNQIYGINTAQNALVVANADGTQRQLFKNGLDGVSGLVAPTDVQVSSDGQNVYVSGSNGTTIFDRDSSNGNLANPRLVSSAPGSSIALNATGDRAYIANTSSGFISAFSRDSAGNLTIIFFAQADAEEIVTSEDGTLLFAVSRANDSLTVFDTTTFQPLQTLSGAGMGLDGASDIALSRDLNSSFVYVTGRDGNTLSTFARDLATNFLTHVQTLTNGVDGVSGLAEPTDVAVTPDDQYVLVTGKVSNAISVFQRNAATGELLFVQILRNNLGGLTGLNQPNSIASSPSGANTYFGTLGAGGFIGGLVDTTRNLAQQPVAVSSITTFENIRELTVTTGAGDDTIKLINAPDQVLVSDPQALAVVMTTINTHGGQDTVNLEDASPTTEVHLGAGSDTATVTADTPDVQITIRGDAGTNTSDVSEDEINIEILGGGTTQVEIFGGEDRDTVKVTGTALPATSDPLVPRVIAHGDDPSGGSVGDTLIFDPQNPNPNTPNYSPAPPNPNADFLRVNGFGAIDYDTFEGVVVLSAPIVTFPVTAFATNEGQGVNLSATVNLLGATAADPLLWDIDGDGVFGEFSGNNVGLTWEQLLDFGINDDGVYQIGVQASSSLIGGQRGIRKVRRLGRQQRPADGDARGCWHGQRG